MAPDSGTGLTAAICIFFGVAWAKAGARAVARTPARPPADRSSVRRDAVMGIGGVPLDWLVSCRAGYSNGRLCPTEKRGDGMIHSHSQWGPLDQIGAGNLLTV